ncbi:carbon-phosphorus lyase complex subunit PhnI [Paenibacillus thalictri]|uniref:Carbon-phosphorus lyase n=1 Tax=Paenibacillus thalictri TaxID=2527873 RepID=A0A4Q9DHI8_9BACL|nr:carbon-phosphorus lyase complex subunit PhnI [Paenibacillus thalictri]TBL70525.1 carbon-phosphorus lyase [Paenibacillus thalictri]
MAYVAVTGGQKAIEQADLLTQYYRLKDSNAPIAVNAIEKQLRLLVDRIMSEGGLYAPEHAAVALKQAEGDPSEAAFLIRAYRSTLPRNHYSQVIEPAGMRIIRRISSSFRDIPGGQLLGPTYDYTHRMLKFSLRGEDERAIEEFVDTYLRDADPEAQSVANDRAVEKPAGENNHEASELLRENNPAAGETNRENDRAALESTQENGPQTGAPLTFVKVADLLREQGLMGRTERKEIEPYDITREKLTFPAPRSARLQTLTRGETGAMTALAYSSMRGYGAVHPTIGELRVGYAPVYVPYPGGDGGADDDALYIGEVMLTEVESINSFTQNQAGKIEFLLGYGLCFGQNELKAIAMSILERSLETTGPAPAQDEEFVLLHIDSVESNGFVSHLKLPHYITFQSSLDRIRDTQARTAQPKEEQKKEAAPDETQLQPARV